MSDTSIIPTSLQGILQSISIIAAIMLAAFVLVRSRTPKILKDELNITRDKCDRLERDNHNLIKAGHLKDIEISELKAKTDLQTVMESQNSIHSQLLDYGKTQLAQHKEVLHICSNIVKSQETMTIALSRLLPQTN